MISSSFVINQWKLYSLCDCAFSFVSRKALTTLTSLKSHSSTKRTHASFPYGCSLLNLTYVFCQLNNLIRDSKSPRKSKNNFIGITMGISKPFPRTFFFSSIFLQPSNFQFSTNSDISEQLLVLELALVPYFAVFQQTIYEFPLKKRNYWNFGRKSRANCGSSRYRAYVED